MTLKLIEKAEKVTPSQEITKILKLKSTTGKSTINMLADLLILIRKLEKKSILEAKKYIVGLWNFPEWKTYLIMFHI